MSDDTTINLEDYFQPRPYQLDLYQTFFTTDIKRFIRVGHRRYGKDFECFNLFWVAALVKPGLYLYLLPTIGQARSVIWEGRGKDGVSLLDRIPKKLIASANQTRMSITLVNGSILHITGGNNYEAIIGTNPLGVVLSEFQSMNPMAWELFLRAILAENGGWAIFNGTPRGHNHFYELVEQNKDNPNWYVTIKTVEDTKLEDGSAAVPAQMVEEERAAGMPEDLLQQEFYCSFEAAIRGAFFSEQMKKLKEEGRLGVFNVEPKAKVYTGWDLGVRDATSIWFMQNVGGEWRIIYHLEESNRNLEYFIMKIKEIKQRLGFLQYGMHFVPHDIAVREWGAGKTRIAQARDLGIILTPVTNIGGQQIRIIEGISIVRYNMAKMRIHSQNCKDGVRALMEYHAMYDDTKKTYLGPNHNWASHACSAMATLCVGYMDQYDNRSLLRVKEYASYIPCS